MFTGSEQGGVWTAPTCDGLVARLVEDAGGHYLLDQETEEAMGLRRVESNIEMELEQFALLAADADAWGKVVYAPEGWYREDAAGSMSWLTIGRQVAFSLQHSRSGLLRSGGIGTGFDAVRFGVLLHDQPAHAEGPVLPENQQSAMKARWSIPALVTAMLILFVIGLFSGPARLEWSQEWAALRGDGGLRQRPSCGNCGCQGWFQPRCPAQHWVFLVCSCRRFSGIHWLVRGFWACLRAQHWAWLGGLREGQVWGA